MTTALTRAGVVPQLLRADHRGPEVRAGAAQPRDGRRARRPQWLVAPYGMVAWVLNARAAGEVRLTRRFSTTRYTVREVGPDEAGPVLKEYVSVATVPRPYFARHGRRPARGLRPRGRRPPGDGARAGPA